jgi:hypothetical protein
MSRTARRPLAAPLVLSLALLTTACADRPTPTEPSALQPRRTAQVIHLQTSFPISLTVLNPCYPAGGEEVTIQGEVQVSGVVTVLSSGAFNIAAQAQGQVTAVGSITGARYTGQFVDKTTQISLAGPGFFQNLESRAVLHGSNGVPDFRYIFRQQIVFSANEALRLAYTDSRIEC